MSVSKLRNSDRLHEDWYRRSRSPSLLGSKDSRAVCWATSASARSRCPAASVSSRAIARSATLRSTAIVAFHSPGPDRPTGGRVSDRRKRRSPRRGLLPGPRSGPPTARGPSPAAVSPRGGSLSPSRPTTRCGPGRVGRRARSSGRASIGNRPPWIRGAGRWPRGGRGHRRVGPSGTSARDQNAEELALKVGLLSHIATAQEPAAQGGGLFLLTARRRRRHQWIRLESRASSARSARSSCQEN